MAGAMMQEKNQRKLEVNEFHNQVGYLSDPPAEHVELFGSLIRGLNNCPLTHALRVKPVICNSCINTFWNTAKINRQGAGSIEAIVQKTKIIVTEAIAQEVLILGDQPYHPTSYDETRVLAALRRMSYEGSYPTVLKKLFPPYWRLLVHFLLQCIAENKGGFDQLNKTQTSAIVALVNGWDFNFSAFNFDNMKKMLDDPKKKIFMLYPRFIPMILDDRYPALVKAPNFINLKSMGPCCFENASRNKRAKHHNFKGKFALEKHGRFANDVQGGPVSQVPPVAPVAPVPHPINAQITEEHDVQLMQQMQQAADSEEEVKELDSESETDSSEEETECEIELEIVMPEKEEEVVREPVPMTAENMAALLLSVKGGDGIPPSVSTTCEQETAAASQVEKEIEAITNDAEEAAKKQRTNSIPDDVMFVPSTNPENNSSINPQPEPKTDGASEKINTEDADLYDFNFDFETTPSQPGSSSGGVRFEAGSSSGAGTSEHDEAAFRYAAEK
ncbi:hypothetical protein Hanom_Chr09g00783101 [Helianthus anomalus]